MNDKIFYPQFRKYPNDKVFFKIISDSQWEEIHVLGKSYSFHQFTAKILPDRNFIYDMTFEYFNNWQEIDEDEYEAMKANVKNL